MTLHIFVSVWPRFIGKGNEVVSRYLLNSLNFRVFFSLGLVATPTERAESSLIFNPYLDGEKNYVSVSSKAFLRENEMKEYIVTN